MSKDNYKEDRHSKYRYSEYDAGEDYYADEEKFEEDLRKYRVDVIKCLMKYGNFSQEEAALRIDRSHLLEVEDRRYAYLIFHDEAYHIAMCLIYRGQEGYYWHLHPELWPPPKDAYDFKDIDYKE